MQERRRDRGLPWTTVLQSTLVDMTLYCLARVELIRCPIRPRIEVLDFTVRRVIAKAELAITYFLTVASVGSQAIIVARSQTRI